MKQGTITPKPKRKRNNKNRNKLETNSHTIFPLLLAALCTSAAAAAASCSSSTDSNKKKKRKKYCFHKQNPYHQLLLRLLNQLRLSLLSETPNSSSLSLIALTAELTLPAPILSLLPVLLTSRCAEVVCKCVEFVGAALLFSLEMNEQIANDDETVKGLILVVASSKKRNTLIAACNAVLDMSTTSNGRKRLLEFSALECLIFRFLQVSKSSKALGSLFTEEQGSVVELRIVFEEDELPVFLLDAAIILINMCKIEQLEKIPRKLLETLLSYLERLWADVRSQILLGTNTILKQSGERCFFVSNIRTNDLAESIFRLSSNVDQLTTPLNMDVVRKSIFSRDGSGFQHFILNQWEVSPLLIGKFSKDSNDQNDIFSSFRQSLDFSEAVPSFLSIILKNLLSCPPIASDELDILSFLKEVKSHLGCPMIYQQDIRVLKTLDMKREVHFFQELSGSCCFHDPQCLYMDDILRCKEAYAEGYTVALRGMEFRFESIAAIADGLASLFGQPSAGVNMYLTPPNSQGLVCHCDDHCVFVCQLVGVKKWTVFPPKSLVLPRLYKTVDNLREADRLALDGYEHFLLREGDVLYIPRGCPHKACTVVDNDRPNETAEFSLHLTLAIEVEPPFEWEGFAHVALQNWYQNQKHSNFASCDDSLFGSLNAISVNLMHVVIKLIGDADPTFRKACLVGAISLLSDSESWLDLNQRTLFSHLLESINHKSRFSDALRSVTLLLRANKDPLQQMRWLEHLDDNDEVIEVQKWNVPSVEEIKRLIIICDQHKDEAEAAFVEVKTKFCGEVVFDNVEQRYKMLLEKYRKVRRQYMSGMLSLHCD